MAFPVSLGAARFLADDIEDGVLERFLVFAEPVLLPGVVVEAYVEVVPLHAALEEAQTGAIVGLLLELEGAAVLHELAELRGVPAAQFLQTRLNLLLFDVVVLFVLAASGQALPWEGAPY
eukprot:CAMPEP_0185578350 /NCGR_PEP_ID=MMETSP0434-20130131/12666_1 /TAXON_ID=626734 ORGANISM="Favella taraikaensis, Strain Fe Narragansett Bay" /NCGR_SAMPLE_ID=MMETSP0434 /ASSEMBLY_ACC=CAM_ASM_000379 /LENGTH=119 /DNA_ID=CAMNT_0028196125 /DNA_START=523 /DNA_END=881 /DNA_ORIENTATION=+